MKRAIKMAVLLISVTAFAQVHSACADELKYDAIYRVAHSQQPDVAQAIARIYVKQSGLTQIRAALAARGRAAKLGTSWNNGAPEWQAAETRMATIVEEVLTRRVENPQWFYEALSQELTQKFKAEEADEIATHLESEGGRLQAALIDYKVIGEMLMTQYTFTGRIRHDVPGTEKEMQRLQTLWWIQEPFKKRDFSEYPNAMRFAGGATGVKYVKLLVTQGVAALTSYIDQVAKETTQAVASSEADLALFVEQYRSRVNNN